MRTYNLINYFRVYFDIQFFHIIILSIQFFHIISICFHRLIIFLCIYKYFMRFHLLIISLFSYKLRVDTNLNIIPAATKREKKAR